MKILLEIPLSMSGGYGKDGIGLTRALLEHRHEVTLVPTSVQVPLPVDIANQLSVERYADPPYDVRITHVAPGDVWLSPKDAGQAKTNIFWTMWEWENYLPEYAERYTAGVAAYDWVVTYDSTSRDALAPFTPQPSMRQVVVQGGYESEDWRPNPVFPTWEDRPFVFGTLGDQSARKNPVGLIKAFRLFKDAHPDANASLVIKSRAPFLSTPQPFSDPEYGILEINGVWNRAMMEKFYYGLGAYVAPSYGEGKNLPALEAATCGVPLILSEVAGHVSWGKLLDSAVFVGGDRHGLRLEGIPVYGLKVDEVALAQAMAEVYYRAHHYHMRARANVGVVVASMDWYKVVERLSLGVNIPWL